MFQTLIDCDTLLAHLGHLQTLAQFHVRLN